MNYLFFDIESCSEASRGGLCSFGYCLTDRDFNIIESEDILVNPVPKHFDYRLKGRIELAYPERAFRAAPKFDALYDRIKKLLTDNIVFGFSTLNDALYLYGAAGFYRLPPINFQFFDVQIIYSVFKNESRGYSLKTAADEFGFEFTQHCSMHDAIASMQVLKGICRETNLSFDELKNKYELRAGACRKNSILRPDTLLLMGDVNINSRRNRQALSVSFTKDHNDKVGSSKIRACFDENLEGDMGVFVAGLRELEKLNWLYAPYASCNAFVYKDKSSERLAKLKTRPDFKRIRLIDAADFFKNNDDFSAFDGIEYLKKFRREKKQERIDLACNFKKTSDSVRRKS